MLQIVGALILLIAGFAILRLLFRALISTASALAGLILLCLFGPALLAGYITERITRLFHIRWLAGVFLTIAGMIISFMWGLDGKHIALEAHTFDSVKFILTTALAGGLLAVPLQIKNIQQNGCKMASESIMVWHLNRSRFGIRIDHDLASISDHSLASQSITIWHASDH